MKFNNIHNINFNVLIRKIIMVRTIPTKRRIRRTALNKKNKATTTATTTPKTKIKHDIRKVKIDGVTKKFDLTSLDQKIKNGCQHSNYGYSTKKIKNNGTCTIVGTQYLDAFNLGIDIPSKYLDKYMAFIFRSSTSYWARRFSCIGKNQVILSKLTYDLLTFYQPKLSILKKISTVSDGVYFPTLKGLTLNKNFKKFSTDFVIGYLKQNIKNCDKTKCTHSDNLNFLLAHTPMNQQLFDYLLECRCSHAVNAVLDIINGTFNPKYTPFNNDDVTKLQQNILNDDSDTNDSIVMDKKSHDDNNDDDIDDLILVPADEKVDNALLVSDNEEDYDTDNNDVDNENDGDNQYNENDDEDDNDVDNDNEEADDLDDDNEDDDEDGDNEDDDDVEDENNNVDDVDEVIDITKLVSYNSLYAVCKLLPESSVIVDCIVKKGFPIDSKCLEIVCEYCNEEAIKYILDYKIPVEKIHFRNILNSKKYITSSSYKKTGSYSNNGFNMAKAELLFQSGYRMDYDDIIYTIDKKIVIDGIERFGIILDDKIYEYCHSKKFYPDYKFELANRLMLELQKLCNGKSLPKIQKFVNDNNLKPDQTCLYFATKISMNFDIISYLIDNGCIMDAEATKNFITALWELTYRRRDKDNTNDVMKIIETIGITMDSYKNGLPVPTSKQNNTDNSELVNSTIEKVVLQPNLIEIDGYNDTDINDVVNSINVLNLNVEVPNNIKRKLNTPKLYMKYFGNKVNSKMSFTKVKTDLLKKMKTKKWLDSNNKEFVNLPEDLRKELGIQSEGLINISDIDKVVSLFYK